MKTISIFIFLTTFSFTGALYSQVKNDLDQKEIGQRQRERAQQYIEAVSELEAKKAIFSFFYDTKSEVRKLSMGLSSSEWEQMKIIQEDIWNNSVRSSLENYSTVPNGYSKFLRDQYEMLLKYKDVIMDMSYSAMHQDLSEEVLSSISADAIIKVKSVAKRDF